MTKQLTILILILSLCGFTFAEDPPKPSPTFKVGLLREGFTFNSIEGTVTKDGEKDIWYFAADEDVNDQRAMLKAGTKIQLLPSSTLERIISIAEDDSIDVSLRAIVTSYAGQNFLFPTDFIPLGGQVLPEPVKEPVQPPQSAEPPKQVEEPSEDSIIPLDVMTRLKPKKVVSLKKMKKQLDVEGDAMLVDRTGFVIGEEADNVFVIDELGRNVEQISFQLLPCQAIQRVERKQNQSPARQRYRIAAIVTKYKGDYYLLFQRAVRTYSHGNFAR